MFFTREDINKIYQALLKLGIKDSELPETSDVKNDDTLAIVQDGKNKQINVREFLNQISLWKREDFINITDKYKKSHITLVEAIQAIPIVQRKEGLVITFLDNESNWRIYQFRGSLLQFNNETLWVDLYDFSPYIIDSILPDEEDITQSAIDEQGNTYLSLKDREYSPSEFSGKGYKILRRNIIEIEDANSNKVKKNVLYQDMINKSNTIYEIRYDFDLNNQKIELQQNCILYFNGGRLFNGTLISNDTAIENCQSGVFNNIKFQNTWNISYISYTFFNNYINDTELLRAIFNLGLNGKNKCVIDLESRQYNVLSERLEKYGDSIYRFVNSMNKTINGNNAIINDKRPKEIFSTENWDGILGFDSSHNISIINLNYINNSTEYEWGSELGYKGPSFILLNYDCSGFNIISNITGARYGVKVGNFNHYWITGEYGIKNSTLNITAFECGYPVAIEAGDNLDISVVSKVNHRAAYLCGISNSKIRIKAKDIYIAPVQCLLSDTRVSKIKDKPNYKSCYNLDVEVHDMGTTIATNPNSTSYLVGFQSYTLFKERTEPLIWNNINVVCIKEKQSDKIALFTFSHLNTDESPNNINDLFSNITIKAIDVNPSTSICASISPSQYKTYKNISFEVIAPQQKLIWDNASKGDLILQNSELKIARIAGNIKVDGCKITSWEKLNSNIGVDWYEADVNNSDVHIINSVVDKLDVDFGSLRYSDVTVMPKGLNKKSIVFDNLLRSPKIWDGAKWRDCNGVTLEAKKSGTFAEKPRAYMNIYPGYSYFCTDRQTSEGSTNGIVIYHKGDNVWVDALGRVVS